MYYLSVANFYFAEAFWHIVGIQCTTVLLVTIDLMEPVALGRKNVQGSPAIDGIVRHNTTAIHIASSNLRIHPANVYLLQITPAHHILLEVETAPEAISGNYLHKGLVFGRFQPVVDALAAISPTLHLTPDFIVVVALIYHANVAVAGRGTETRKVHLHLRRPHYLVQNSENQKHMHRRGKPLRLLSENSTSQERPSIFISLNGEEGTCLW
tara:strand:+ start:435 stop:1067 length:633 start_codon:yes stop_codon:yes gene_type:complete